MEIFQRVFIDSFTMPATVSLIMTFLYTVADGIFITRGVGSSGIAAVNTRLSDY